jgi:hypothetical protein
MAINTETIAVSPKVSIDFPFSEVNPIIAKVGGLQSRGAKGEGVVNLLRTLGNSGSGVLRLSRRVNNMASNRPYPLNSPWVGNHKGKPFL